MGKSIKGTRTEKNLAISFAGESQARMRDTYFASVAKKEGFEQISAIFMETADQEKELAITYFASACKFYFHLHSFLCREFYFFIESFEGVFFDVIGKFLFGHFLEFIA